MKTFCVYLLARNEPVEIKADSFTLVGKGAQQVYRFAVETEEGTEIIAEIPARSLLLVVDSHAGRRVPPRALKSRQSGVPHGRGRNRPSPPSSNGSESPINGINATYAVTRAA